MDIINPLLSYLPHEIVKILKGKDYSDISELRFCPHRPVLINNGAQTHFLTDFHGGKIIAGSDMFEFMLHKLTGGSMYSVGDKMTEGFITLKGGHRVGICGSAVMDGNKISHIRNVSALCFRVSREVKGCAVFLGDEVESKYGINNILIASPPGCGKTTVLRDLCRIMANGELTRGILRVGIADERSEIAATDKGKPSFDIGVGAFVCDGYPKTVAMTLMLRSMSPDVIVTDEIGTSEDFLGVRNALKSGVSVIATAHAGDLSDLKRRFGQEIEIFDKIIFLRGKGKVSRIYRRLSDDY